MAHELTTLAPNPGATCGGKRVGRGEGSGKGKTCGRGTKGAQSRSGYKRRAGFEGGQMPLARRLPKFGFSNYPFKKIYTIVNIGFLAEQAPHSVVTAETLAGGGLISQLGKSGVKILGVGEISVPLHVRVAKVSRSAAEKIIAAGGTIEGPLPGEES